MPGSVMEVRGILCCFAAMLLCGLSSAGSPIAPTDTGKCWAMGDPHYHTFDGLYYNFMGNCSYILAKNCHEDATHPAFEVDARNYKDTSSMLTAVGEVTIKVYGYVIQMVRSEFSMVRVNYDVWSLPVTLKSGQGQINMIQSGLSVVLWTDFGLTVQYDWEEYVLVTVPSSFMGMMCGLCGNFNGQQTDDIPSSNVDDFGHSWRVPGQPGEAYCSDECSGECGGCNFIKRLAADVFCSVLTPIVDFQFRNCHSLINSKTLLEMCKFDYCRGASMKNYICDTLQVYTDACQRAGVKVFDWRHLAHCPNPTCPDNSHYEQCGNACPSTCGNPVAPSSCTYPCVETCTCDTGYVRSGKKCVHQDECGCQYNGRYLQVGQSFWGDDQCTVKMTCTTGAKLQSQQTSCPLGQTCEVINGIRDCYPLTYATCMVSGDPHYMTFDGETYSFQGTCVYQMAGVCTKKAGLEPFNVLVQNDGRDKKIGSVTKLVEFQVYGNTFVITKEHPGLVMINGELTNMPVTAVSGKVKIYASGFFAVIETDFGVKVSYDWNAVAYVVVPNTYMGAMCGMCGNFNHNATDDLRMKDGTEANTAQELGQSWRVAEIPGCVDGCKGPCPDCDITQKIQYETNEFCGMLKDPSGPFRDCVSRIDPSAFFQNCLYDVCLYQGKGSMQCKSLTAYTTACQAKGITVYPWRTSSFCSIQCPANSHYDICVSGCPTNCQNLTIYESCNAPCQEGCTCDSGYVVSGVQCVPLSQCGCQYKDRYYKIGQVFYPDGLCAEECVCNGKDGVSCKQFTCGPQEKCEVKNGVRSCQPTAKGVCSISGDPHYNTFDNDTFTFQGTCTYIAAEGCHLEGTHLSPFSVVVENEKWYAMSDDPNVSVAKLVAVEVYGMIIILRRNQIGLVMVNGAMTNLPLNLNNGQIKVFQDGTNDVILTDFGLKVTYDLVYHVTITVPSNYYGKTCGLCGNFNGKKGDEFQLPDGKTTKDLNAFGAAWKVSVPGVVCDNGCSGDVCPKCDPSKQPTIESDCSIITNPNDPFAACQSIIDPAPYFRDCVYDVCIVGSTGNTKMLCHSIAAYMIDCQNVGVQVQNWRSANFCPLTCPANSHYETCAETCATPCPGLSGIACTETCAEGCACNTGYYFNGSACVALDQCSCYINGYSVKLGQAIVSEDCHFIYICQASGVGLIEPLICSDNEVCQVRNEVRGCFPKECVVSTNGMVTTFNGLDSEVNLSGAYEIVKVCNESQDDLYFRVVVKLQSCKDTGKMKAVAIYAFFQDHIITVNDKFESWVNGKKVSLPSQLEKDISVQVSEKKVVIEKKNGLKMTYSQSLELTVTVSEKVADKVCGACGKTAKANLLSYLPQAGFSQKYMDKWLAPDFPTCY